MVDVGLSSARVVLLLLAMVMGGIEATCGGSTPTYNETMVVTATIIENVAVAMACPVEYLYTSTGTGRVYLSVCKGSYYSPNEMVTCSVDAVGGAITTDACSGQPTPPESSEIMTTTIAAPAGSDVLAYFLQCTGDLKWVSGASVQMSQCSYGSWSPVLDVCVEGCDIPKDCSELADMGFAENGVYNVIPSGFSYHEGIQVYCIIDNTTDDWIEGGWTVIARRGPGFIASSNEVDITQNFKYFMGITSLKQFFQEKDGTPRPQTVQFRLFTSEPVEYHATYKNVLLNTTTGSIQELFEYQGNAGNAFKANKDLPWDDALGWWYDSTNPPAASLIGSDDTTIVWPTLPDGIAIDKVTIRMRPTAYDTKSSCPPIDGVFEPSWLEDSDILDVAGNVIQSRKITSAEVQLSRGKGATVSYACKGVYKESNTGNASGTVTCIEGDDPVTAPFKWSEAISLPCVLSCPTGFTMAIDEASCYYYSDAPEPKGVVGAAVRCIEKGSSSLAFIRDEADLTNTLAEGVTYFTTHAKPGVSTATTHANISDFCDAAAGDLCEESTEADCAVVTKTKFQYQSCRDEATNYACMWPPYCPGDFKIFKGGCYQAVKDFGSTPIDALIHCATLGAALAYPPDVATLEYFQDLVRVLQNGTGVLPTLVVIGLNNVLNNDFTMGGLYNVSEGITSLATGPDNNYALNVVEDVTAAIDLHSIPIEKTDLTTAICQFPGYKKCAVEPPPETVTMARVWDNSTELNTEIVYSCYPGYFINNNITLTIQTAKCYGQLGEWLPAILPDCIVMNACNDTLLPTYELVTVTLGSNHLQVNGTISFACPGGMGAYFNGSTVVAQDTTCSDMGDPVTPYAFDPIPVPCNVCISKPSLVLATSDWANETIYYINDTVIVTCDDGHTYDLLNNSQIITCTDQGWQAAVPCYKACVDQPVEAGSNMTRGNYTSNAIGASISYDCANGYYIVPTPAHPAVTTTSTRTCSNEGIWEPADLDLTKCDILCLQNPQGPPVYGDTSWDGSTRAQGTQVTLSCPDDMLLGDGNASKVLTCDAGNWTQEDPDLLVCRTPINVPLPDLPEGMTMEGFPAGGLAWQGLDINFTCPNNTMTNKGEIYYTVSYNGTDWVGVEPDFVCLNTCSSAPLTPSGTVKYNYTQIPVIGAVVAYHCKGGRFIDTEPYYYSVCNGDSWNLTAYPFCEQTTPGPPTVPPVILPTMPPYDPSYRATSDYYWGTIQSNMSDANGEIDNYATTNGPFGFGYAVSVSSTDKQCMIQDSYQVGDETCTKNPKNCLNGISVSVWEMTIVSLEDFSEDKTFTEADYKYIISTGGDADGHPGIALYHEGFYLNALVSTGDEYWTVKVAGTVRNATWNNIALRWKNSDETNPTGLELFVNLEKVGQSVFPMTSSPKDALDPSLVMVGCHKTQTDQEYRGYNDAEYDELAMWKRKLQDNETAFFLGGFERNFSNISPTDFIEMLEGVDLTNPSQQRSAVEMFNKLTAEEPMPSVPPETTSASETSSSSSSSSATQSTASSPTAATATSTPPSKKAVDKLITLAGICNKFTAKSTIPFRMGSDAFSSRMGTLDPISNLLNPSKKEEWLEIQKDPDNPGSLNVITNAENWLMGSSKAVRHKNGSDPVHELKETDNTLTEVQKLTVRELQEKPYYEFPVYKKLPSIMRKWDLPYDRVAVPTKLFGDKRCQSRSVNVVSALYNTAHLFAPTNVNTAILSNYLEYKIVSRILSVMVDCDPILNFRRKIDPSAPPCKVDPKLLSYNPVRSKFENLDQRIFPTRKPLFHSNETINQVNRRLCAWHNPDIGDNGAWDTTGCMVVESTDEYTKCACDHFGQYAILAEQVEPREVPPEQLWLTITKYIGYCLSFIALLIFIIVVAVSGDLKDQFHLIGVNLALAVFLGSIFMLVSDMDSIRDDRHVCTAIGTIIHIFYLGAGAWIFVLGHASFKAITSGLISGRLRPYFFLAWSVPIISVGLTYILFLHDLGLDPRCFISWVNTPKYIFFGPQIFFCAVAFVFGAIVICNMSTPALRKDNLIEDYGTFCYGASFVMIFFAITWTFGLLTYVRFSFREPDFYPIFQVFNSCMGIIIFLFIGLGSRRFRMILAGQAKLRRQMLFGNAFGKPAVPVEDKQHLGSPADQRSKDSSLPSSGRASPDRPATAGNDFPNRPVSRGAVAGRPGSRPHSGF